MAYDDAWWKASDAAALRNRERDALAFALARDGGLAAELDYLVTQLSADLGGPFLRAFVDRLMDSEADDPSLHVTAALEDVVLTPSDNWERDD